MPPALQYPDLVPPPEWTYFRVGAQVRLIPPGTRADTAPVAIIISPLVPRQPQMPGPEMLVRMALEAEAQASFEITAQLGPTPIETDTGLRGVSFDVTGYARPSRPVEHRLYVMLADDVCFYGISYLASPGAFETHLATFWHTVHSVRPFAGRAAAPSTPSVPPAPFAAD
ncbi:MAG: hypothetical protein K8W52_30820 [Deltaproteobacteria bacterium]|nr:hypothetical protein [Deltaproteobacteria bacterium]